MDRNLTRDVTALRTYDNRDDNVKYTKLLRTILQLFGEGIIDSLEYTLHKYLQQTDGALCNSQREDWEVEAADGMLCHNNNAERPFAVVRSYKRMYPAISIRNLSRLSQTLVSGSHTPAEKGELAGVALTADPRLKTCIGTLCGVRKVKIGKITQMLRAAHTVDTKEMIATRKRKAIEKYQANVRKKAKKAALRDHAEEVAVNSLVTDVDSFKTQLLARGKSSKARISFLKDQFHARTSGDNPRLYTSLGSEFRQKHGKLRLTCKDKSMTEEAYLQTLITAMIAEDADALGVNENNSKQKDEFIRTLPTLSEEFLNPKAANLKADFSQQIAALATPTDDPVYLELVEKYNQKILYDFETRATAKLFRVISIQFVRSYTASRFSCWEATCEPVYRDAKTGNFHVPCEIQVPGSHVTLTHALVGYCVAEYAGGLEDEPSYLPWVDNYISHFNTSIMPKYLIEELPSSKDLPSHTALPAKRRSQPRRR